MRALGHKALLVLLALAGCGRSDPGTVEVHPESRFIRRTGAHAGIDCGDCHDRSQGVPDTGGQNAVCTTCHTAGMVDAAHAGVTGYAYDASNRRFCLSCHPDGRVESRHPVDRFPLAGTAHQALACGDCHDKARGPSTAGANTSCVGCHDGTHARASVDAIHRGDVSYAFDEANPRFCLTCHPDGRSVDAHPEARFAVATGPHAGIDCASCHDRSRGSFVKGFNATCVPCHKQPATDTAHANVPMYAYDLARPASCLTCHPAGRTDGSHPEAKFAITTGAHKAVTCTECHDVGRGTPVGGANTNCVGCHDGSHARAVVDAQHLGDPAYAFDTRNPAFCLTCHPSGAGGGTHPETKFAVKTGAHAGIACTDCHSAARGTPIGGFNTTCVPCHEPATVNAQHAGNPSYVFDAAKPSFCLSCHPSGVAAGAHPETSFPIATGAHKGIACTMCHDAARGTPADGFNTTCVPCHVATEVNATHLGDPAYVFDPAKPSFCLSCHPRGVADGVHPETNFPIRTGAHSGQQCTDCHVPSRGSPVDGYNTSCTGCHTGEHARAKVDAKHVEVSGYVFSTTNPHFCLRCHPRGRN